MEKYVISRKCMECGECKMKCPKRCIRHGTPYYIEYDKCDDCGLCYEVCPYKLIKKN